MLDAPVAGASYCIPKAAMEELCRHLPLLFPVTVHSPRLGRVETDQTASLVQISGVSALEVALEQLKQFGS